LVRAPLSHSGGQRFEFSCGHHFLPQLTLQIEACATLKRIYWTPRSNGRRGHYAARVRCARYSFLVASVCLSICVHPAWSQVLYGSLTGNITDPGGAAVAKVKVDALHIGTGTSKSALTDERGSYLLSDLQPGNYKVTVSAPSFATRVMN